MMSKNRATLILVGSLVVGVGFWYLIFNTSTSTKTPSVPVASNYIDKLSGEPVNKESINDTAATYPLSPYFIGFDNLQQYILPDSATEAPYVQDFIANYVMEHVSTRPSAISFVKNSLSEPTYNTQNNETTYSFKFGINDGDIHSVSVVYNPITPTISVSISQNDKVEAHKTFTVYYE